ncbi:GNAT family N-acetyltransferase [Halobacterium zhouii]|uniref:GNAT family N-acetyltransferase n=1 Tax=Halobacterium zhouii TaxID=2902624 RepID=UPI001E56EFDD|nr:GNAT family N-acetyltransferase [Halobacterium zhouii]
MDVRTATTGDGDAIRAIANASLHETYADALGEQTVSGAVDKWYNEQRLTDRLSDEGTLYLVVADGDDVVAFSESDLSGEGAATIEWLHVHPDHRNRGLGKRLLEHTETELRERGANRVEGRVLAANDGGNAFYQEHGYVQRGERTLDLGGEEQTERVYVKLPEGEESPDLTEERETEDGTLYVAYDERERGSLAPFYATYRSKDRTERYGYYCANCESMDAAMDSMGRVSCGNCGNERKATRWDAAYL